MNKILFKLIEGKGKFFLMRDDVEVPRYPRSLQNGYKEYYTAIKLVIDEALKNGEIVNPGVLPASYLLTAKTDGTILGFPEGMGFEETQYNFKTAIRLLPEKPVQKEEQERDYARHKDYADSYYNKGFNEAIEEVLESATIVDNLIMITREEIQKLKR